MATIIIIVMLSSIVFADTGVFINSFSLKNKNGTITEFAEEDVVDIERESENTYIIGKGSEYFEVPKSEVLKTKVSKKDYKVLEKTFLLDKPEESGNIIKTLNPGEIVNLVRSVGDWGIFVTEDMNKGFGMLKYFKGNPSEEAFISHGLATVDKVIKYDNNKYYVLEIGETTPIKDYRDKKFIALDENGCEFSIPKTCMKLNDGKGSTSRNIISRKTSNLNKVINDAYSKIGRPYVYGDKGSRGFDCSGFTCSVYEASMGIELNRSSRDQSLNGISVERSELKPGDLIFFNTSGNGISHVGLYIGDGKMIHASTSNSQIEIADINSKYYSSRYVKARRIITK
ncbi:C40 family peptidase [Anaerosalibacter sp. Marseille-P3206]|uniref:C40 family peptidase n=1 Tax=Anaerosalibacter sp. Marseille-P3206 TaxID=1871005 RepID=UPI001178A037|nr:C40 family peptidase [Anaerosalibacter sp. Marseille-P3206]